MMIGRTKYMLAAVGSMLLAATAFIIVSISEHDEMLADATRHNLQWTASQAVTELLRLQSAVGAAPSVGATATIDVQLRYDILANRLTTLRSGEFREFVALDARRNEILDRAVSAMSAAQSDIQRAHEPAAAAKILEQFRPLNSAFVSMAAAAYSHSTELAAKEQAEVSRLHWTLSCLLIGLIVCCGMLIGFLLRNNRVLGATHQRLERAAADLHAANEEAQAASRAKSQFLANMSHEIRTPMNGVFGMTNVLRRSKLTSHQHRLVDTIHQSAQTLLGIINDILDLSRIEAGRLEMDQTTFDLRHCVEGAVMLFAEQADRKSVALRVHIDKTVPTTTIGDSGRLRQVCVNLIGNALKFTSAGTVAITATAGEAEADGRRRVRISVRDTGIGMSPEVLKNIAKPFVQADSSISRRFGGTGLGLAISKQLVEAMGGTLTIESSLHVGTEVSIVVPFAKGELQTTDAVESPLRGRRLLIIDATLADAEIVADYAGDAGAETVRAASIAAAQAQVRGRETPFDAVLLEADLLKAGALPLELRDLPVILMTRLSWSGDASAVGNTVEYLPKPIRRKDLRDVLARVFSDGVAAAPVTTHAPEVTVERYDARVLVAEDNPVNQEVALEFLAGFGCTVDMVGNGLEAVQAAQAKTYDLIFMDCQMPVLDGYSASRRIRAGEAAAGTRRVPIIALTANAYASDRQTSADAGMDAHISKPFSDVELGAVLASWLPPSAVRRDAPTQIVGAAISEMAIKRPALFQRLIRAYESFAPSAVASLAPDLDERNFQRIKATAHSLKSASANLGAVGLSEACGKLEAAADVRDVPTVAALIGEITHISALALAELARAKTGAGVEKVA